MYQAGDKTGLRLALAVETGRDLCSSFQSHSSSQRLSREVQLPQGFPSDPPESALVCQSPPRSMVHTSIQVHTCPDPSIPCLLLSMSASKPPSPSRAAQRGPTLPDSTRRISGLHQGSDGLQITKVTVQKRLAATAPYTLLEPAQACSSLCIFHTIPHSSAVLHSPSLHMTQFEPDRNIVIARLGEARDLDPLAEEYAVGRAAEVKHPDKRTISMYDHKPRERASTGSIRSTCL